MKRSNRNSFDLTTDPDKGTPSKISNQTALIRTHQKIATNPKMTVSFCDTHVTDVAMGKSRSINRVHKSRNADRVKFPTPRKYERLNAPKFRAMLKGDV
jgi:hypothetical protein